MAIYLRHKELIDDLRDVLHESATKGKLNKEKIPGIVESLVNERKSIDRKFAYLNRPDLHLSEKVDLVLYDNNDIHRVIDNVEIIIRQNRQKLKSDGVVPNVGSLGTAIDETSKGQKLKRDEIVPSVGSLCTAIDEIGKAFKANGEEGMKLSQFHHKVADLYRQLRDADVRRKDNDIILSDISQLVNSGNSGAGAYKSLPNIIKLLVQGNTLSRAGARREVDATSGKSSEHDPRKCRADRENLRNQVSRLELEINKYRKSTEDRHPATELRKRNVEERLNQIHNLRSNNKEEVKTKLRHKKSSRELGEQINRPSSSHSDSSTLYFEDEAQTARQETQLDSSASTDTLPFGGRSAKTELTIAKLKETHSKVLKDTRERLLHANSELQKKFDNIQASHIALTRKNKRNEEIIQDLRRQLQSSISVADHDRVISELSSSRDDHDVATESEGNDLDTEPEDDDSASQYEASGRLSKHEDDDFDLGREENNLASEHENSYKIQELKRQLEASISLADHERMVKDLATGHEENEELMRQLKRQLEGSILLTDHEKMVKDLAAGHKENEEAMRNLKHQLEGSILLTEHQQIIGDLTTERNNASKTSQNLRTQLENSISLTAHQQIIDEFTTERDEKEEDIRRLELQLQNSISLTKHQQIINNLKIAHEAAIKTLDTQHVAQSERALATQKEAHSEKISTLTNDLAEKEKDYNSSVRQIKREHLLEKNKMLERQTYLEGQANEWDTKLKQQRLSSEKKAKDTAEKLQQQYAIDLDNLTREHAKALADADQRHRERKQELIILQDRLQKRENYVGLKDSQILDGKLDESGEAEFYGMATLLTEVKKFAAWSWREDRKVWPHDLMLSLTGDTQNRLKRLILGDLVWNILFHTIFCSPFRLLGEIGKKLENDWNQSFPAGPSGNGEYNWPSATLNSEKWRYDTCEDALKSLTNPTTQFSEDGRLKKSFFKNHKVIRQQLCESIGTLVDLDEEKTATLDTFLLNSVRMWLYFGTQRYRLYLTMPGSIELDQEKKMKLAQDGKLIFTVAPRLERFGNAKGLDLQEVSVISGCEGKQESASE